MKKSLIFGVNGYIGRHLAYFLNKKKIKVIGFDIHQKSVVLGIDYYSLDNCKRDSFKNIDFSNVDYVFYFSGLTGINASIEEAHKYIMVNEIGLTNVLDFIVKSNKRPRLILPSTRLVYKGIENKLLKEDAEKEFKSVYALNKFQNEKIVKIYSDYYGLDYLIFRIGIPYGNILSENYSYGTIGMFLKMLKSNSVINLYGKGEVKRTFTHIEDLCNQIMEVTFNSSINNEIFNLKGETYSLKELAEVLVNRYGGHIRFVNWPQKAKLLESGDTIFDSAKITPLIPGLKHSIKQWVKNI